MVPSELRCSGATCPKCSKPYLQKIMTMIEKKEKILLTLPAFPGKSSNPRKALSHLRDMEEQCSLEFFNELCLKIKNLYQPGAEILLCSDGKFFSDLVGIKEDHITAYKKSLIR